MTGEQKAELRQLLSGFDLNAVGMVLVVLTLAVLGVGAMAALLMIFMRV
jgi:hypothetical protein